MQDWFLDFSHMRSHTFTTPTLQGRFILMLQCSRKELQITLLSIKFDRWKPDNLIQIILFFTFYILRLAPRKQFVFF